MNHRSRRVRRFVHLSCALALSGLASAQVGTVRTQQKISPTTGGWVGAVMPGSFLGTALTALGDLDGDGVHDLVVSAPDDSDGGAAQGAVWVLLLNANGTVKAQQKISATSGGFGGTLGQHHYFGYALSALGDLDDDGIQDLAVGAVLDDKGAVWILFLNANGTVKGQQKISSTTGGFGGVLTAFTEFGSAVAGLGDLDGDGVEDLAVGADSDDQGGQNQGALWILFLNTNGTVKAWQKINETNGGFGGRLDPGDLFGVSLSCLGDLDRDGAADLVVGVLEDDDGGADQGAAWILFLNTNGTVRTQQKISATAGGFGGDLDPGDNFGRGVAALGDLDGDGILDLAVGARFDADGGFHTGAVWILFLEGDATPPVISAPAVVTALDAKGSPGTIVTYSVSASDAFDPSPALVCVPPSGSFFQRGTTLVTCTATDNWGNVSVVTFPVIVHPSVLAR